MVASVLLEANPLVAVPPLDQGGALKGSPDSPGDRGVGPGHVLRADDDALHVECSVFGHVFHAGTWVSASLSNTRVTPSQGATGSGRLVMACDGQNDQARHRPTEGQVRRSKAPG